ncbi:unnamed protein product [Urochloa humidicola]
MGCGHAGAAVAAAAAHLLPGAAARRTRPRPSCAGTPRPPATRPRERTPPAFGAAAGSVPRRRRRCRAKIVAEAASEFDDLQGLALRDSGKK